MSCPIDHVVPLRFLRMAYEPSDWLAVFLKSYDTGQVSQRIGPRSVVASRRFQAWLRWRNLLHCRGSTTTSEPRRTWSRSTTSIFATATVLQHFRGRRMRCVHRHDGTSGSETAVRLIEHVGTSAPFRQPSAANTVTCTPS